MWHSSAITLFAANPRRCGGAHREDEDDEVKVEKDVYYKLWLMERTSEWWFWRENYVRRAYLYICEWMPESDAVRVGEFISSVGAVCQLNRTLKIKCV